MLEESTYLGDGAVLMPKPIPEPHRMSIVGFVRGGGDHNKVDGTFIRESAFDEYKKITESRIRELEQALREIGKHTMESEDDIDFIIDACHAALHVTDKAAKNDNRS